jgi:hypothetical protein
MNGVPLFPLMEIVGTLLLVLPFVAGVVVFLYLRHRAERP